MLILAADMDDMLSCPARQFIEEVPVVWDETRVLSESRIGEFAAVARHKGDVWYLSVLNGETPFEGKLKLDFLPKGKYRTIMAADDGDNRKQLVVKEGKVKSGQSVSWKFLSGGGCVVKFEPIGKK